MRRRRHVLLLTLLLLLGAGWLWLRSAREATQGDPASHAEGQAPAPGPFVEETPGESASLAGSSAADPPPAAPGTRGDVRVRVVGPGNRPVPDHPVVVADDDGAVLAAQFTNERGERTFGDLPLDGTARVAACGLSKRGGLSPTNWQVVTGTAVTLRTDLGLPCEVLVTDAETGRVLADVGWSLYPWEAFLDGSGLRRIPERRSVALRPGLDVKLSLRIAVPLGYVAWSNREPYVKITRFATALRYVVPLHREADVVIDVLEHDGSPARDPFVVSWDLAGREVEAGGGQETEPLAMNLMRLRGVPYIAGAMLHVKVRLAIEDDDRVVEAAMRLARPTRLVIQLPHPDEYDPPGEPFEMPQESAIGIGGSTEERPPIPPPGVLELEGFLRNGRPAAHGILSLQYLEDGYGLRGVAATLDGAGRLAKELPAGTWEVYFREPGLVQTLRVVEIRRGETTRLRLQEGEGCTVRVHVVDPAGRPLPFARFRINDWTWRDLQDGVQRLDPYVDEDGSRTLRHVSPDQPLELTAWYAGARGHTRFTAGEGETVDVTVVVEPAK